MKKILILALAMALIQVTDAAAHKVIIFAWVEDGMIHTESSFGSKRKAKDCAVTVLDENGRVVYTGRTDAQGNHAFRIPENINSDLIITLDAGTGHKAQWRVPKSELISNPSDGDLQAAMAEKEKLEQGPSFLKILSGIGIIFLLAFFVKFLKRKKA